MQDFISTGIPKLDVILGGGIARSGLVTISGEVASGKTILLSSVLSRTELPVIHFLTEDEQPKYVSMEKENYSFVVLNKANQIREKIVSLWSSGFEGIIAVDPIDFICFGDGLSPGDFARSISRWICWFLVGTKEHPKKTKLEENRCAMIITNRVRCQSGFDSRSTTISSFRIRHLTTQGIFVRAERNNIFVKMVKNRYGPVSSEEILFEFDQRGIIL